MINDYIIIWFEYLGKSIISFQSEYLIYFYKNLYLAPSGLYDMDMDNIPAGPL